MGRVIAFFGRQSKVGRTTAAVNLGVLLGRAGNDTLLVHFDDQWPAAVQLGQAAEASEGPLRVRERLELALPPAGFSPADVASSCETWRETPDFLLLDLPATEKSVDPLLMMTDEIVFLLSPGRDSLTRLAEDMATLTSILGEGNANLKVLGLLVTRADRELEGFERFLLQVERSFPVEVFPFTVPTAESMPPGCAVDTAPTGRIARCYVELAMEVMQDGG